MKDFLYKMAGLGTEYRIWSLQIRDQLCLEVSELHLNPFASSPQDKNLCPSIAKVQTYFFTFYIPKSMTLNKEDLALASRGVPPSLDRPWSWGGARVSSWCSRGRAG